VARDDPSVVASDQRDSGRVEGKGQEPDDDKRLGRDADGTDAAQEARDHAATRARIQPNVKSSFDAFARVMRL